MYYKPAWEVLQHYHHGEFRHNPNPPVSNVFRVLPFPCYRHLMEARIFLPSKAFRNTRQRLMDPRWNPLVAARINTKRHQLRRFQDQGCNWESRKRLREVDDDTYLTIRQQHPRKRRHPVAETETESEELADIRRRFRELVILTGGATVSVGPTPSGPDLFSVASSVDRTSQPPSLSDSSSFPPGSVLSSTSDTLADRRHIPVHLISVDGLNGAPNASLPSVFTSPSLPSTTASPLSLASSSSSVSSAPAAPAAPSAPHSLPSPMPPESSLSSSSSFSTTQSLATPATERPSFTPSGSLPPPSSSPPSITTTLNPQPPCSCPPPIWSHSLPPSLITHHAPRPCTRYPHPHHYYSSLAWLLEEQSVDLSALEGYRPLPYSHSHHCHQQHQRQQQPKGDHRSHVCYESHGHTGYHDGAYKLDEQVLAQARAANWWTVDPEGSLARAVGEFFAGSNSGGRVAWGYGWFLSME